MKKRNSIHIKVAALLLAFAVAACDSFLDINESPNAVTTVAPKFALTSATSSVGFHGGSDIHRFTSIWAQQFTGGGGVGVQTVEYSKYNITATDVNNVWRTAFFGETLSDLEQLRLATEGTSPRYAGIAKLLKAYMFTLAVDAWGDIPYDEALQFADNTQPVYDDSEEIYTKIFALIDEALGNIAETTNVLTPGADDLIYAGDVDKWTRFGNSLKLRMLVKYYPTNITFANTQIAALLASPGVKFIETNANNFQVAFETSTNRTNSIDQFERRRLNQFWPTTTIVSLMNTTSDPRRPFYFTLSTTPADVYEGQVPGSTVVSPTTSRIHTYLRGAVTGTNPNTGYAGDAPQRLLTASEHFFNLAEYYLRSGDNASAQTAYETGIRRSLEAVGVSETNVIGFLATATATLSGTPDQQLRQIIEQKYIANYGVPLEPWSDWRRTGYPVLALSSGAVLTAVPRILPYSDLERVTNPLNTPPRETADLILPNVFWDPGL